MKVQGSENDYVELDHTKSGFLSGDFIITHDKDTYHELAGMTLLENRSGVTILEPQEIYSLEKSISSIVFFTKIPHSVSVKRNSDSVRMTVTM